MATQSQRRQSSQSSEPRQDTKSRSNNRRAGLSAEELSRAAQKMRSSDPQERSEGARIMGRVGGRESHKND